MLDTKLKAQLKEYLTNLKHAVEITAFLNDSAKSQEMRTFLEDIAPLSSHLSLSVSESTTERTPSFLISNQSGVEIRFAGIPMGHEFTSLVLAILQAGGHPVKASDDTISQVKAISELLNFEVFVSLSCQNCPDVVQAINMMASLNPAIRCSMIDGSLFQDEVSEKKIMAVPSVYLNGELFAQGRMNTDDILAKLGANSPEKIIQSWNDKPVFDVLIIGAGPAGSSAAIYSARKGFRTGIVAERIGGQVLDTTLIENFISIQETEGKKLASSLKQHIEANDIDVMEQTLVEEIIPGEIFTIKLSNGAALKSKTIILATGAHWRELNVPGEAEYKGKGIAFCTHCDGPLFKDKRVAVVGGGNSGAEAAIDLAAIATEVTLLEYGEKMRADAVLQDKLKSLPNVTIRTQALSNEITGDGDCVNGIRFLNRTTNELELLPVDGVFIQIGLRPKTDWLANIIDRNQIGEIEIDTHCNTSMPGIFAAGDATITPYKQIIIAMGEGAKAALSAFDYLIRQ